MASRWARIRDGILGGVQISKRIRIAPVIQTNWGLGSPRRPPGVNSGTWACYGGSIWVRLGDRQAWPNEDMDAKMIDPVEPS
jgi:hypothetical protein